MKTIKWLILVLVIAGGMYLLGAKLSSKVEYKSVEKEVILDNLTGKVNQLKGELINDLRQCESGNADESRALITFDPHPTNKKVQVASLGVLQFKVSTVQFYYKKFYNKDITPLEAVKIALDNEKASALASDVIFKDGQLDNWYNCTKKLGLKEDLNIINKLLN